MKVHQLTESRFLKKEDAEPAIGLTITKPIKQNVAPPGQEQEHKYVLYFEETDKGLVLNPTNGQLIAAALGSDDSDDWTGKKIALYKEANVSFGGKLIGGIRARKFNNEPAPTESGNGVDID